MFDSVFGLLSEAPLAYVVLFAIAAGDAILPLLPSESAVILAGVLSAAEPNLALEWVIGAAAAGALVGDSTSYALGRSGGRLICPWLRGGRRRATLRWARRELDRRGGVILVVARFVPGGRTAATLTAGVTRYGPRRFAAFAAIAAVSWAFYAALLGYVGGRVFHDRAWLALVVAFTVAAGLTLTAELVRRALGGTGTQADPASRPSDSIVASPSES